MNRSNAPLAQDLVLVGGGHAHALALAAWSMRPLAGARLTLVSPDPTTPYTGMLPGVVAGRYAPEEHEIDLVRLARRAGARLILDRAVGLDLATKTVTLEERGALAYDVLSLDIGSSSEPLGVAGGGFEPVKPFGRFLPAYAAFLERVEAGRAQPRAVVIGGGLGGVELAFAIAWRLRGRPERRVVMLTQDGDAPDGVAPRLWRRILDRAPPAGVEIRQGFDVVAVEDGAAIAADGRREEADLVLSAAGARPAAWLAGTGLPLDKAGFVRVGPTLAAEGFWDVFAAGDIASMGFAQRPKAGVFAVRQAPTLARNLREALIAGGPEATARYRTYRPQRDYLKLVSLGSAAAIAEKGGLLIESARIWRLKDRIDRRFMRQFDPKPMAADPPPKEAAAGAAGPRDPLCAGCGAKIGADALEAALATLGAPKPGGRAFRGPGDDAALLALPDGAYQAATIDQLRAFTEDVALFAEIATVHSLGDVAAMGGRPEAALLSITLPPATPPMQARLAAETLAGVRRALAEAGAELVGGHTAEGPELSLGVVALGRVAPAAVAQLSGAEPGDALLLTKPLGVGVLLAAEMRQAAPGRAVAGAVRRMRQSNGPAAEALMASGARAMTDVTGFGLLGHLARMLCADLGAEIALDAVPFLEMAPELVASGVRSSLHPANAALLGDLDASGADPARVDLLVDPQTAGGLLAALPAERADAALAALRETAPEAAIIGSILRSGPGARFRLAAAQNPA